jgi:anti-sigma factor RsiW
VNVDRKLDDATLMRYLDGDLGRDEAREAERAIAADPALQVKARALGQLGEIVVARYDVAADEVDDRLAAMWEKIQPSLGTPPAPERSASGHAGERGGFWAGVQDWLTSHTSHFVTGVVAAAAGAVIATLVAGRGGAPPTVAPPPIAAAEVESLEVADGTAAVFQVPGSNEGEVTTMIWITPTGSGDDSDEGPI